VGRFRLIVAKKMAPTKSRDAPDSGLRPVHDVPQRSLVDAVYESLLEAIVRGTLPSGTVLSEVALARQLDVSRTPVHDALRQLAKDGLVEQEKRRRARVARFTRDDIYEIFELRKYLEGPAAELAAGRMDDRQLGPLRAMAEQLAAHPEAVDWTVRWADFDEQFHRAIAEASGNKRLAQDVSRYRLLHRGFNKLSTDTDSLKQALAEHLEILAALEARDGPRARDAMVRHISTWQAHFMRTFPR
jgi:DNA-binding GntR family transcriptional regulator